MNAYLLYKVRNNTIWFSVTQGTAKRFFLYKIMRIMETSFIITFLTFPGTWNFYARHSSIFWTVI
jgi:hypothetical protein